MVVLLEDVPTSLVQQRFRPRKGLRFSLDIGPVVVDRRPDCLELSVPKVTGSYAVGKKLIMVRA